MRTIIDLDEDRLAGLDDWAASQNVSRAEAVRRSVDLLLKENAIPRGVGFGLWMQHLPAGAPVPPERDGLAIQAVLRSEWDE